MKEDRKKKRAVELAKEMLGFVDDPKSNKYKPRERKFIYIGIDRKYLGMTEKERTADKKVSNRK